MATNTLPIIEENARAASLLPFYDEAWEKDLGGPLYVCEQTDIVVAAAGNGKQFVCFGCLRPIGLIQIAKHMEDHRSPGSEYCWYCNRHVDDLALHCMTKKHMRIQELRESGALVCAWHGTSAPHPPCNRSREYSLRDNVLTRCLKESNLAQSAARGTSHPCMASRMEDAFRDSSARLQAATMERTGDGQCMDILPALHLFHEVSGRAAESPIQISAPMCTVHCFEHGITRPRASQRYAYSVISVAGKCSYCSETSQVFAVRIATSDLMAIRDALRHGAE
jgi:hypothetical protein